MCHLLWAGEGRGLWQGLPEGSIVKSMLLGIGSGAPITEGQPECKETEGDWVGGEALASLWHRKLEGDTGQEKQSAYS